MTVSRTTAREVGAELRRLRIAAGLTLRDLESRSGHHNAKISMWESGRRLIPLEELDQMLGALEVDGTDREHVLPLRREGEGSGRLMAGPTTIGARLAELISQERSAIRITEVAPLL